MHPKKMPVVFPKMDDIDKAHPEAAFGPLVGQKEVLGAPKCHPPVASAGEGQESDLALDGPQAQASPAPKSGSSNAGDVRVTCAVLLMTAAASAAAAIFLS
jgi:hypothetical protein